MRFILLIGLAFLFSEIVHAQECSSIITGRVIDLHDKSPLSGATIIVAGIEVAVQTDLDGYFRIENLCDANYSLQVSHPECTTQAFKLQLNGTVDRVFYLEHHLESLNEILLTSKVFTTKSETVLENSLDLSALEKYSGFSLGDALKDLSGVSTLNTGNTVVKPVINGLHSSRISLINNGVRMQDQEWGVEHAPNLDINSSSRITVLKGASALQFTGDAIGGIIVAEPERIALKDTLYGRSVFTFGSNGRGGSNSTTLIKSYENGWSAQLQGTLKRFGDYEAPDYILSNTGNFERNMMFRIGLNKLNWGLEGQYSLFKNDVGILRASHLGGAEDLVRAINSPIPLIIQDFTYSIDRPKQEVQHQLIKISGFKRIENLGKLTAQYDFQLNNRLEFDVRRGDDAEKASVDLELSTHNFAVNLEGAFNGYNYKVGGSFNYQENFANPETGVRRLIPDYEQYKTGVYAVVDKEIGSDWIVEGGFRYDYTKMDAFKFYRTSFWESRNYDQLYPEIVVEESGNQILTNPILNFNNMAATLGTSVSLGDQLWLFVNFSLATRAPNASELFSEGLHHSASRIELGDLGFQSEKSKKVVLAFQKKGALSFALQPFYNRVDNFVVIEPTGVQQTIRGNFQVWEYRQVLAELYGIDFDLNYKFWDHFNFKHQFSITKGYERSNDQPLINLPPASFNNAITYQKDRWTVGINNDYFFRQNEFPDTNFEVFLPDSGTLETVDVSSAPEAYTLWHCNASYSLSFIGKSELTVGAQINNVFNTSYRSYLNRLRYYADDLGTNIILQTKINF